MRDLYLVDNSDVNWDGCQFVYDENGQAHEWHLHWGDDYTLEQGNAIDDVRALAEGYVFSATADEEFDEWN